tara:strand:+ start:2780 stop:3163 length:384 start_codon:yes stop_codon:yes gene_type:complete
LVLSVLKNLFLASSAVSWAITVSVLIWVFTGKEPHNDNLAQVHHLASEYAFHVIEQGLAGKSDSQAQFEQVSNWKKMGWTAQTGALKTLCNIDQKRMELVMDEKVIKDVCRLIRLPEPLSALTPLES